MEIKDLLDRFELLYPANENLKDLRRSYTDKDLSSIFRLVDNEELRKAVIEENLHSIFRLSQGCTLLDGSLEDFRKAVIENNLHSIFRFINHEELRKAVIEKNLHSIFRLVDHDELKKLVLDDNIWSLWKLLSEETSTNFISSFKHFQMNNVVIDNDCFSRGQLQSKIWLVDELKKLNLELGTVFLCAGWYATLATMLFENNINLKKVRSFDIDATCASVAERFNKPWEMDEWKFKASTADINSLNYKKTAYTVKKPDGSDCELTDIPDTIINTSCEHIDNFSDWYDKIPEGKLVILQTNNYFEITDHVNCSQSLIDFEKQTPMGRCLFQGELDLAKYKRFMRIGYK